MVAEALFVALEGAGSGIAAVDGGEDTFAAAIDVASVSLCGLVAAVCAIGIDIQSVRRRRHHVGAINFSRARGNLASSVSAVVYTRRAETLKA